MRKNENAGFYFDLQRIVAFYLSIADSLKEMKS